MSRCLNRERYVAILRIEVCTSGTLTHILGPQLSGRNSKRVIRSETPEEEEAAKPKQVPVKKPVAVSMVSDRQILPHVRQLTEPRLSLQPNNTSAKPVQDLDIGEEDRLAMEAMMDMSDNFDMPSSSAVVQPMDDEEEGGGTSTVPWQLVS